MKRCIRLIVVAGLVFCTAGVVTAQPGRAPGGRGGQGPGGYGSGSSLALLRDPNVRKELEITADQVKKLDEFQAASREEMRRAFQGLRDLSNEERQAKFREFQAKYAEKSSAAEKEILLPKQAERLKEIAVQARLNRTGLYGGLTGGPLAKELGITDAQKEALRKAQEENDAKLREEGTKLRDAARQKVLSLLTDEQRAKLKSLTGEPIQFSRNRGAPGVRGSGGPGGRGERPSRPRQGN